MNGYALILFSTLCIAAVHGRSPTKSQFPRGCSSDAVAIAGEYLQNGQSSVSSMKCFQEWAGCVEKSYSLMSAIKTCAAELNRPELLDNEKLIAIARDTSEENYQSTLQAMCCIKQKEATLNGVSLNKVRKVINACYNKETC